MCSMPGPNTLQNQPLDILISISQALDHASLLRLRLVSRSLNHAATPYALRHVAIVFEERKNTYSKSVAERLYGFKDNPELVQTLARHVHHLTICSDGYYFENKGFVPGDSVDPICEGLRQFKSVRSLDLGWKYGYKTPPDMEVFIDNLQEKLCLSILEATGHSLEELTVSPPNASTYVPKALVASPLGLRSFYIEHDRWGWNCRDPVVYAEYYQPDASANDDDHLREKDPNKCPYTRCDPLPLVAIQKIIQSNPTLEKLHIMHGCMLKGFGPEHIFPQRSNPSPLTSLIIKGFNLTSVSSLIPANSLCNLTHLTAQNPASQFKYDILWSSLKAAHAELKSLVTYQVSYSLCVYLASYSGLQELVITEIENDADSCSEKTLSAFFDDALPQHADTLSKLEVTYSSSVEGDAGWAFSKKHDGRWSRALSKLTALTSLHLDPRFTLKISEADSEDEEDSDRQNYFSRYSPTAAPLIQEYRIALDHIAEVAPQVESVRFLWCELEFGCGTGRMKWKRKCDNVFEEVGKGLDRPSRGPERLILGGHAYRLTFDQEKGMFGYIKVVKTKTQ